MEVDTNCLYYDNDHIEFLIEFMTLPAKRQSRYLRLVQLFFKIETETSRIPSSFVFVAGGKSSDDKDGKFC